jgi:hypothetical protein
MFRWLRPPDTILRMCANIIQVVPEMKNLGKRGGSFASPVYGSVHDHMKVRSSESVEI